MREIKYKADYIIETGWEICNKIGGIHTVMAGKATHMVNKFNDNYILIGPDVWKETHNNPEFIENKNIYKKWHEYADKKGIKFRIGNWNVPGSPIVILVDFSQYIINKDQILTEYWEEYKLDSISGEWDYIEPALFGYAAAKAIESFYEYHISAQDKIVAHFNEWSSGTGVLYLKKYLPQVATVFTAHGNVVAKELAKDNKHVAFSKEILNVDMLSYQYNIRSKYSLERSAVSNVDTFTTVSEICKMEATVLYDKKNGIVTPNGFDPELTKITKNFNEVRAKSRKQLINTAKAITKQKIDDDCLMVLTSGTHQIKSKGFDLLIDSLAAYNKSDKGKSILAYIAVPANVVSAREDIDFENISFEKPAIEDYLTHWIFDYSENPIINQLINSGLRNRPEDKVKIIFVPTYLDGKDGIFNISYYEFLAAFDVTIFPSLYEPWGYTPHESAALGIPTLTTNRSGFGLWIRDLNNGIHKSIYILDRALETYSEEIIKIKNLLHDYATISADEYQELSEQSKELAKNVTWDAVINNYYSAHSLSIEKAVSRFEKYKQKVPIYKHSKTELKKVDTEWRKIFITMNLPESLNALNELSKNYWWSWNFEAIELFESIDPLIWKSSQQNPIAMIEMLSYEKIQSLEKDTDFLQRMNKVHTKFKAYIHEKENQSDDMVAYFSMEFGIHDSLKIYSGGLGILAGDYLKEASDSNRNMIGIGLLYRYGYFKQELNSQGEQINTYISQKFSQLPLIPQRDKDGNWQKISIAFPGRTLYAKIWRVDVGRIPLYLLDTDFEDNNDTDRTITHNLYGGDWENRFKQEMLLGVGGIRVINELKLQPKIYHCNEGHAAFMGLERLKNHIQGKKIPYSQAIEIVRSSSLFTTHTPVPAGHDYFSEDLLRIYMSHYPQRMNITWETLMNLGKMHENNPYEKFSMSILATKLSQEVNGVSKIHGRVSREMFVDLYKGYFPEELHIGYVTNGVHYPTWAHKSCQKLHYKTFGKNFLKNQTETDLWKKIFDVPDNEIWNIRKQLKFELINYIKIRLANDMTRRQDNPSLIFNTLNALNENAFTIGFARRFATYKRAKLLFSNLDRLSDLVNDPDRPIQLIYAGKAHPADKEGKDLIKSIIEISRMDRFLGKVIFIENYDIPLAQKLISGCDLWLNTPTRPLEASGTSGEKAAMNGVLNFSVLDGWWGEGYTPGAGWALKEDKTYLNQNFQDLLDAETIYDKLKEEIVPIYYQLDDEDLPSIWIQHIKKNWAEIAPRFTMKRQVDDYYDRFYSILFDRTDEICKNKYELASQLSKWKTKVTNAWENIYVVDVETPISEQKPLMLGEIFSTKIKLHIANVSPEDIGVEVLFAQKTNNKIEKIYKKFELIPIDFSNSILTLEAKIPIINVGVYDYVFRLYPKNENLPHRQDFDLVKWF